MNSRSFHQFTSADCLKPNFKEEALNRLAENHLFHFSLEETQRHAWAIELDILHKACSSIPGCTVAMEYMIPRMGKRVDAVLLTSHHVFVIEFKVGEKTYPATAIDQVLDYCFDLRNFHSESHDKTLIPIVVCTEAKDLPARNCLEHNGVYKVQLANKENLAEIIRHCMDALDKEAAISHECWLQATYSPTPTIVEAAQALYRNNKVEDISRNEAGLTNISATTECVNSIIRSSKEKSRKSICFVTGVPGAGKTLVGLNLASIRRKEDANADNAIFLSGNGPLIEVLQASLVEDQQKQNKEAQAICLTEHGYSTCNSCSKKTSCVFKKPKYEIKSEVKSFVQGVHLFREELFKTEEPPPERIAIFDESQRAWTEEWLSYKMKTRRQNQIEVHKSEPHCLVEYMDRHQDWACIVCLVGGGQEINRGEAGIVEWFKALHEFFPHWEVYVSNVMNDSNYLGNDDLVKYAPNAHVLSELHLAVDMRSFRNKNVAAFAEALVNNEPDVAKALYKEIESDYPIYVTRDLFAAKEWVRKSTERPSDRYGVIADSYGQRIRADGIIVPVDFDAVKWFLRGKDEIDSSYFMEIAASEFKIQGLEIDYAVVAWEGDYRYQNGEFRFHRFKGGKWQNVRNKMDQRYLRNGYRVLLTRARQGYVIYVPKGSDFDPTRKPEFYDQTYAYLKEAGIEDLPC